MPCSPARGLALKAFGLSRRKNLWARDALRDCAAHGHVKPVDRALAWRLVMGATLTRGLLEERVLSFVAKPSGLEPRVGDALLLGAFELGYLATPVAVAVDEWVEAVKAVSPKAVGLANAVLRKVAPLRKAVGAARERLGGTRWDSGDLATASGLPRWLLERVIEERGPAEASEWALGALDAAPLWLVATSPRSSLPLLEAEGLKAVPAALPGIWRIGNPQAMAHIPELVGFSPEDRSAFEIALASVPAAGGSRLEVGVGRGTKALVAATVLETRGKSARLVGVDLSRRRVAEARERFERSGYDATFLACDGRAVGDALGKERFDIILVDAPCSGTGTLRRHPEIAWNLKEANLSAADPASLPTLQLQLLRAASTLLAEGGSLLYATCSILKEENHGVVEAFLAGEDGARYEPGSLGELPIFSELGESARAALEDDGFEGPAFQPRIRRGGPDGHFLAVLRKGRG